MSGHEVQVELQLDGRYADAMRVRADAWSYVTIQVPQRRDGRRFRARCASATVRGASLPS